MNLTRSTLTAATTVAAAMAPAIAEAGDWDIDSAHTSAQFSVRHMMVTNVRGFFSGITGRLHLDPLDVTGSKVEASIDASTVDTREPKRDAHLRSADFFDVAKYPKLTFTSTKVAKAGGGHLKVLGDLTVHGVTRPVTLDVELADGQVKGMDGRLHRGATATAKINRKEFGLNWNMAVEAGGLLVGDEISIQLDVELVQDVPAKS